VPDNFTTLSSRLLNRAPEVGLALSQQLINDSWHEIQSRRPWSWRMRSGIFAPPDLYTTGSASSNVATGNPTLITGSGGTVWTPAMIGSQIRLGGLLYPYYTIVGWISSTQILIDSPWAGPDVTAVPYQILKLYYPVPDDFGYWDYIVSIKDAYQLWGTVTEADLALLDPQRTNQGQTYGVALRGWTSTFGGTVGPIIPVAAVGVTNPVSTTSTGFTYVTNATYIIQIVGGGGSGTATFQWMRAGQTSFTGPVTTDTNATDLMDGVQVYFPTGTYIANDLFIINCQSLVSQGTPLFELWPAPTFSGYLYPYQYYAKESDLSPTTPNLPPFIANRGEVVLELALSKAATYPGTVDRPNPYYSLALSGMHNSRFENMMVDLERNDEEIGVTRVDYKSYPFYPAPWLDGNWQQQHSPFLRG
jgi:hypothetical protein